MPALPAAVRFLLCFACVAPPLTAQPPVSDGAATRVLLTGRVTSNGQPVAGAQVSIAPHDVMATTSDSGTYRIHIPAPGQVRVSVRAIGFEPAARRLILAATDSTVANFALTASVQRLAPVEVEGVAERRSAKMTGFEQRRQFNFGTFKTRADLAEQEQRLVSDVLRGAAGVRLERRSPRCGGGFAVASGRGPATILNQSSDCGGTPNACYMTVFLDGMMIWAPGMPGPPDVDEFRIEGLEAVEIYRGGSQTPIEFNMVSSNCGVLVLWTRVGGR